MTNFKDRSIVYYDIPARSANMRYGFEDALGEVLLLWRRQLRRQQIEKD